jgi:MerR family transcriptional regulator, light-induced transcriptional regulator
MENPTDQTKPRHAIGIVVRRTGLKPEVLRAWEARYGAVTPEHTPSGHRLYSDLDIERILLMRQIIETGRRIGSIARLSLQELIEEVRSDDRLGKQAAGALSPVNQHELTQNYLQKCLHAITALDRRHLSDLFYAAQVEMSRQQLRNELFTPLIILTGERWREGSLRIVHEHLATSVLRCFLDATGREGWVEPYAPCIIVTTPVGQHHELGALMAADIATEQGWDTVYLGPDLPAEEIAAAVRLRSAKAVALSIVFPAGDPRLGGELELLRRFVGDDVSIIAGGESAASYSPALQKIKANQISELIDFQRFLVNFGK